MKLENNVTAHRRRTGHRQAYASVRRRGRERVAVADINHATKGEAVAAASAQGPTPSSSVDASRTRDDTPGMAQTVTDRWVASTR